MQLLLPKEREEAEKTLDLAGKLIDSTPTFLLKCNMEVEAAEIAYQALHEVHEVHEADCHE